MFIFIILSFFAVLLNAQTIDDCGHTKGCYLHPKDCTGSDCLFIFKWADNNDKTDFEINGYVTGKTSVTSVWLAIGFAYGRKMSNSCVVMCQHAPKQNLDSIEHYFNYKKVTPDVLDPDNPTVGLSNPQISVNNGFLTCKFTRVKKNNTVTNYFDINNHFYIIGAYGAISSDGELEFHGKSRTASASEVNFQSYNIYSSEFLDQTSIQLHAILAIVTWIIFVSTGIIVARYYKGLLEDFKPCKVNVWFFLHRPIMLIAAILATASFYFILSNNKWRWVYSGNTTAFWHSISGIITLCLLWIQPMLALFRCDANHPRRFLFNAIHFLFGITAFILSIATMFLAGYVQSYTTNSTFIKLLIGWCGYLFVLVLVLEILSRSHELKVETTNIETAPLIKKTIRIPKYLRFKVALLLIHIIVAIGISTGLLVSLLSS